MLKLFSKKGKIFFGKYEKGTQSFICSFISLKRSYQFDNPYLTIRRGIYHRKMVQNEQIEEYNFKNFKISILLKFGEICQKGGKLIC
jgi:hypothetical protein